MVTLAPEDEDIREVDEPGRIVDRSSSGMVSTAMAAMRSSMAAVSSIVEPFGMETVITHFTLIHLRDELHARLADAEHADNTDDNGQRRRLPSGG